MVIFPLFYKGLISILLPLAYFRIFQKNCSSSHKILCKIRILCVKSIAKAVTICNKTKSINKFST